MSAYCCVKLDLFINILNLIATLYVYTFYYVTATSILILPIHYEVFIAQWSDECCEHEKDPGIGFMYKFAVNVNLYGAAISLSDADTHYFQIRGIYTEQQSACLMLTHITSKSEEFIQSSNQLVWCWHTLLPNQRDLYRAAISLSDADKLYFQIGGIYTEQQSACLMLTRITSKSEEFIQSSNQLVWCWHTLLPNQRNLYRAAISLSDADKHYFQIGGLYTEQQSACLMLTNTTSKSEEFIQSSNQLVWCWQTLLPSRRNLYRAAISLSDADKHYFQIGGIYTEQQSACLMLTRITSKSEEFIQSSSQLVWCWHTLLPNQRNLYRAAISLSDADTHYFQIGGIYTEQQSACLMLTHITSKSEEFIQSSNQLVWCWQTLLPNRRNLYGAAISLSDADTHYFQIEGIYTEQQSACLMLTHITSKSEEFIQSSNQLVWYWHTLLPNRRNSFTLSLPNVCTTAQEYIDTNIRLLKEKKNKWEI